MSSSVGIEGVIKSFRTEYSKTHKRLKVLDAFAATSLLSAVIQLAYATLVGSYPFNSFLAGFFCSLGAFVLTVSLRVQVDPDETDGSPGKKFGEYAFAMSLLFLAAWNFVG